MARTPLVTRFQRLFREHDCRVSRRDFLKTAAAGTAAVLARPASILAGPAPRIAIIGGGIAGLNAALTLDARGFASTVYEASPRIGGRMHSDTTSWAEGQVSEHCGELIDSTHRTILELAKRFRIDVADLLAAQPAGSTDTNYFFGRYYTTAEADADFAPVYDALKEDVRAAGYPTLYTSFTKAGFDLDHLSVYDWIESRVPGGHASPMGQLLDVAYNAEYGAETVDQSSLNLIYLLAYQSGRSSFELFGPSDERYHLVGGNEELPRAIASALPAATIRVNTALRTIARLADGTFALTFQNGSSRFTVVADRVVMAIPFSVLRTLDYRQAGFNAIKTTAIEQLGYGSNAKLHLQFASRSWNRQGPWGVSNGSTNADTGYQGTWDVTRAQPGTPGILVDYTGGAAGAAFRDRSNPQAVASYARTFLSQLEPVFPGITQEWNGRATLDTPLTNPYLLGSYSYWKVGQYTRFSGAERERSGNCHFAGEHCSIDFQGFMEGAAQEGARAAGEILADYKQS